MGLLDRLFGRRGQRGSGGAGHEHASPDQGQQAPDRAPQDSQSQTDAPAGWDVQGDLEPAGGDSGGGDSGGGDSGGDGGGGGGGD